MYVAQSWSWNLELDWNVGSRALNKRIYWDLEVELELERFSVSLEMGLWLIYAYKYIRTLII